MVEISDDSRETYNTDSQIKVNTMMLKSTWFDYSDAFILFKRIAIVPKTVGTGQPSNNNDVEVAFKNRARITDCASEIKNMQIDNAKDIDVIMQMHNLIEYSCNCSKTSEILWQYYRDWISLNDNGVVSNVPGTSAFYEFKQKITDEIWADGWKDVEIMVSLK